MQANLRFYSLHMKNEQVSNDVVQMFQVKPSLKAGKQTSYEINSYHIQLVSAPGLISTQCTQTHNCQGVLCSEIMTKINNKIIN